jgi:hypothetical protein
MPVEVFARPVVAHRGLGLGVPGGDLQVAEADAGVQHGRDEGMTQHMGMHLWHLDPGGLGQLPEPAGRCVPVHPPTGGVTRVGPCSRPLTACSTARATEASQREPRP